MKSEQKINVLVLQVRTCYTAL